MRSPARRAAKRGFDLAIAAPAAVVSAPLVALGALLVRSTSAGPAFFVQERVGLERKPFRLLKLRTMVNDAERMGAAVTAAADPRMTTVGAFLRRWKLDELPQLWNVLRGDMSVVGPRPEVERYVRHYKREWEPIFSVRPGITDLASLIFRDEEQLLAGVADRERAYLEVVMPRKVQLALHGIQRSSVVFDTFVLVRTALAVLRLGPQAMHPVLRSVEQELAQLSRRPALGIA
jgi:lipopolysaccharide/colanic/teichoic acid biosynthesis glycosyltransferase